MKYHNRLDQADVRGLYLILLSRGREVASRQAHNLKIVGSNPTHRNSKGVTIMANVIQVKTISEQHTTNEDGLKLKQAILNSLAVDECVTVSFEGVPHVNTSYVNTAFVELLSDYEIGEIKRRVKIVKSTKQINTVIKERLEFESSK